MLYCYKIVGSGILTNSVKLFKIENLELQSVSKTAIIDYLKHYYFSKLDNFSNSNLICNMMTDSVILNINHQKKTYTLTYQMFSSTEKDFNMFQRVFSPDDFNLNMLIEDKQIFKDIGLCEIHVVKVSIQHQLLGCNESDVSACNYNEIVF